MTTISRKTMTGGATKRPPRKPIAAPPPERMTLGKRLDDALLSILDGGNFAATTDVDVARAQGADAALRSVTRKIGHVARDEAGHLTKMITEDGSTVKITTVQRNEHGQIVGTVTTEEPA